MASSLRVAPSSPEDRDLAILSRESMIALASFVIFSASP
jgi:hypothetical protein